MSAGVEQPRSVAGLLAANKAKNAGSKKLRPFVTLLVAVGYDDRYVEEAQF